MTNAAAGELTASSVIGIIDSGAYPRDIILTIARGFLPLAQDDLIAVLAHLALFDDEEIASTARTSLGDIPSRAVFEFAANPDAKPEFLLDLLRGTDDSAILETLIRNRAVPDAVVVDLAKTADARVQEVIVINQARILRAPEILDALLANPSLTPDARRRALETREEFFEKKARLQQAADLLAEQEPEVIELALDPIADLLEKAAEPGNETPTTVTLMEMEKTDERKAALWTRLQFMTVSEKVQLAFRGDRMIRMLLVRERNKLICSAVMRNPRISEQEVEAIAGMRNVEDEVLRIIATRRDWMSKNSVVSALVHNPKVPPGVVLPLINRLTLRDLKGLKDDKGIQQVVREMARRIYQSRSQKT